jgi:hypothetical protein
VKPITYTYRAKGCDWQLNTAGTGNERISVLFEITQGPCEGQKRRWDGYFTEKAVERTFDSLRHCGWTGDNLGTLDGLDANEVEIVCSIEEYADRETGEARVREKVEWVNRPARINTRNQLSGGELEAFAARMRGPAVAHKQKYGATPNAPTPRPTSGPTRARTPEPRRPPTDDMDPEPPHTDDDIPF